MPKYKFQCACPVTYDGTYTPYTEISICITSVWLATLANKVILNSNKVTAVMLQQKGYASVLELIFSKGVYIINRHCFLGGGRPMVSLSFLYEAMMHMTTKELHDLYCMYL